MADWRDEEERFDVVLIDKGPTKISVLKVVRDTLGLGTAEAKDFIESLPRTVRENLSTEEARSLRDRLEQAGGLVRLVGRGP